MVQADETRMIAVQRNIGSPSRVALNAVSQQDDRLEKEGATIEQLLPSHHRSKKSEGIF